MSGLSPSQLAEFKTHFAQQVREVLIIFKALPFFSEDFHIRVDTQGNFYHTDIDGRFTYHHWSPTEVGDLRSSTMVQHVTAYLEHWAELVEAFV